MRICSAGLPPAMVVHRFHACLKVCREMLRSSSLMMNENGVEVMNRKLPQALEETETFLPSQSNALNLLVYTV